MGERERGVEDPQLRPNAAPRHSQATHNFVLLSDVHLGSDIVPHARPWAAKWLTQEAEIDERLVNVLEHYRGDKATDRPWCLVLAGDVLDLVGVSIAAEGHPIKTALTAEERQHGLGSAPDHVVHKLDAIARRHNRVFQALMRFVRDGHSLVFVLGNHDIELHWKAAQRRLVEAIVMHEPDPRRHCQLAYRISVCPWFLHVPELLYVEHGHEFDPMCGYGDPLLPTCPRDSRRIRATPFSTLLRYVARPTQGLSTASYEHAAFGAYLALTARLGWRGAGRISLRFGRACRALMTEALHASRDRLQHRRTSSQVRLERLAARSRLPVWVIERLRSLHARPATRSLLRVLHTLYLDRVLASASLLLGPIWLGACPSSAVSASDPLIALLPLALLAAYALVGISRGVEPHPRMRTAAAQIQELLGVRWVVMGHTHTPELAPLGTQGAYVNLGNWGEDDLPEERPASAEPSCTLFEVRHDGREHRGRFLRYRPSFGVVPFVPKAPSDGAPKHLEPSPAAPYVARVE